jgi:hypothetical protein
MLPFFCKVEKREKSVIIYKKIDPTEEIFQTQPSKLSKSRWQKQRQSWRKIPKTVRWYA